jgi:hypothetical protein
MPGARCARSLACKNRKHASKSPRSHRFHPAFPARLVLTGYFALSLVIGLVVTILAQCKALSRVNASVEASGPHDFAVRDMRIRLMRRRVHRILCPTFCDDRETSLAWARDGRGVLLIWAGQKAKNFLGQDWTAQISLIELRFSRFWRIAYRAGPGIRRRCLRSKREACSVPLTESPHWRCASRSFYS